MNFKKTTMALAIISSGVSPLAIAEHRQLDDMLITSEVLRSGMTGVAPGLAGTNDTAVLLKQVPGASVNSNGPLSGIAQYRGLFGDRVNVITDGANYKPACANAMDAPLSHVPASMVETLTVYRGIAPISSGIETLGGTIVSESRKSEFGVSEEVESHGKFSAGYNDVNNGHYASLLGSIVNDSHRLHIGFSHEEGDDFEYDGGSNIPSEHDRDAAAIGYGFQTGDHEFNIEYNHNDTGHTGTAALPMDIVYSRGGVTNAGYKGRFQDFNVDARIFYQDTSHAMDNFTLRDVVGGKARRSDNDSEGGGYKLAIDFAAIGGNLKLGIDGDQANHSAVIIDPTGTLVINNFNEAEKDRYGFFSEWKGHIAEDSELELGARYNLINMDAGEAAINRGGGPKILQDRFNASDRAQTDHNIDLVAIIRQSLSSSVEIELGIARKTRSPSYQERYLWLPLAATGGLADGNNYVGDVDLDPEVSYQGELGLNWHQGGNYFAPRIFYRHVNDYIQGTPSTDPVVIAVSTAGGDPAPLQFTNTDAKLYGIDADWGVVLTERWELSGIISYVRGKRRDISDDLFRIAPLNGRVELSYEQADWKLSSEVVAYAAQDDVSTTNDETKSSGYGLFNLRANYQPAGGFTIGVGVENLFDKKYSEHIGGVNRAANNDVPVGEHIISPGRNLYATVGYDW
ncbi:MAG: TonB-dependent receptor [Gammaproteobacteria bacterium]|nr:MAG: TonB-dependent receptor [Gammaproteobacteria bacterium]RLA22992.1 MAG: TonB-dependent receptor [Gammaproteobacteria bacterium]